jgi:nicotinamidase-related amidase
MISLRQLLRIASHKDLTNIAGLVIDMQEGYLEDHPKSRREILIEAQLTTLEFLASRNYPVAVLEFVGNGKGPTIQVLRDKLSTVKFEYFPKEDSDGFSNVNLSQVLKEWGSRHLIIMGINAFACVKQTAKSAIQNKFYVSSAKDLISDPGFYFHAENWYKRNCYYYPKTAMELLKD